VKIGYFADGVWSHLALEKLVEDDCFEIVFIVPRYDTQDPILKEWAKKLSVDFLPIQNVNHTDSISLLERYNADLFVSMSFNQILKGEILQTAPLGFINCHAGELPFYRGRNILNWALINDAKEFGVTVHYIDEGIDTGDIIVQEIEPITDQDDYSTLLDRATIICADLLYQAVLQVKDGIVTRTKQVTKHPVGFYSGYRREGDEWIDWGWSSRRVFNFIRAITIPGPCARTLYNNQIVLIESVSIIDEAPNYIDSPGTIVGKNNNNLIVKTGDSTVQLNSIHIQLPALEKHKLKFSIGQRFGINMNDLLVNLVNRISDLEKRVV
jgi:methionyl-tRNA formyltransferase